MNNKIVVVGLTVVTASLVFAGMAFAQTPAGTPVPGQGWGRGAGMMGGGVGAGQGMMGGGYGRGIMAGQGYTGTVPAGQGGYGRGMMNGAGYGRGGMMGGGYDAEAAGPLHEYMLNAYAQALKITRADLDKQLAAGQTMVQIATAQGLTQTQFVDAMQAARAEALKQAVAAGALTQAQADQMQSRMIGRGAGNGTCPNFTTAPTK